MRKLLTTALIAGTAAVCSNAAIIKIDSAITDASPSSLRNWTSDNTYILTDIIFVRDTTLTIAPGTIVRGEPKSASGFDPGALVITRSAQINAAGTSTSPIIFTTAATVDGSGDIDTTVDFSTDVNYASRTFLDADPLNNPLAPGKNFSTTAGNTTHLTQEYRGLWGGIIILGNAPTSIGAITEVSADVYEITGTTKGISGANQLTFVNDVFEGFVEGLDPNDTGTDDGVYGGSNPNDSSGTLKFVSIRHGGTEIADGNEINGLTMGGVGAGTLIEYIEVYCNDDDGYEWFGGTVNTRYLVSLYNNDDSFDIDEGFQGLGQFWFSLQLDDNLNGNSAAEHDGTDANFSSITLETLNDTTMGTGDNGGGLPLTYITVYNATFIGAGAINGNDTTDYGTNECFRIRDSFGGAYFNSVFTDFEDTFINIEGDGQARVNAGDVVFRSNLVYNIGNATGSFSNPVATKTNYAFPAANSLTASANRNVFNQDPLNSHNVRANIDPRVSLAASGAVTLEPVTATFFIAAPYPGAFNPSESALWTDTWSVFGALFN